MFRSILLAASCMVTFAENAVGQEAKQPVPAWAMPDKAARNRDFSWMAIDNSGGNGNCGR
jgi:hypothetical protein